MTEVVVVGAGIVGAAVARELAVRGVAVTLLDRGEVSAATTGLGEGNVLCSDKDAGPELDLAVLGRAEYAAIEERYGDAARIRRKGALVVFSDPDELAADAARVERLRAAGVECETLDAAATLELEPALSPDIAGATWVPGDLQCDPRAIARALAAEAAALGAEVVTGCEITDIASGGVTGKRGPSPFARGADAVVLAAGPWSAPLARSAGLTLPLEPRKGQIVQLGRRPGLLRRKVSDGGYLAAVASADAGLAVSTVAETTWDGHVLVGSSRERRGFDTTVDPDVTRALLDAAARLVPAIGGLDVTATWAGLRPWLPDHLPAIGPTAACEGLWVATGHEGAGVGLGPITGRAVAMALCGETPPLDLAPFSPDRF